MRGALPPGADETARRLAALLDGAEAPRPPLAFERLPDAPPPRRVAAVDGSHATLADGRSVLVAAHRAAGVLAAGSARPELLAESRIEVLVEGEAARDLERAVAEPVPPGTSLLAVLESLRALAECDLARRLATKLGPGDLLLLDGPAAWRAPVPSRSLLEGIVGEAHAREASVVGVSKSTSLAVGAEPALAHVRRRAAAEAPRGPWAAPLPVQPARALGRAWMARLDAAQRHLFRYDVLPPPGGSELATLAALAQSSRTATYPGYPAPLALAHNAATIADTETEDLKAALRARAESLGLAPEAWEAAFADYHDVLEAGS